MCCLYCGKEIGAFRLLRDSEFCSVLHRQKYGERLGKALHDIAAPEAAPAGVAGFLVQMPFQQGNRSSTLIPLADRPSRKRVRPWRAVAAYHRYRNERVSPPALRSPNPRLSNVRRDVNAGCPLRRRNQSPLSYKPPPQPAPVYACDGAHDSPPDWNPLPWWM